MDKEINLEILAARIQDLPTGTIVQLVRDIAKRSKKKTLKSGTMFFKDFCKLIAENLTKETTKELVYVYRLQD
jgi:hypothetical protein